MELADQVAQSPEIAAGGPGQGFAPRRIAVLVPCFNEEVAIGNVERDFRAALPGATVYVHDDNSSHNTRAVAAESLRTRLVQRLPTAVLATGVMLPAFHSLFSGLVLDTVTVGQREMKRMTYLAVPRHARQPTGPTGAS